MRHAPASVEGTAAPPIEAPPEASPTKVALGVAATAFGTMLVAMGVAITLRHSLAPAEELLQLGFPAAAAGWAIMTGGHMRLGIATRRWVGEPTATQIGWIIGVLLAVVAAYLLPAEAAPGRPWRLAIAAVAATAVVGWLLIRFLGRSVHIASEPARDWSVPSAVIAAFVAMSAITGLGGFDDFYPFSPFRMYSSVQSDPRTFDAVTLIGVDSAGNTHTVPAQISRNTMVSLVRNDDVDRVEATAVAAAAAFEQRRQIDLDTIQVFFDELIIPPYPAAPAIEVNQRTLFYEFDS